MVERGLAGILLLSLLAQGCVYRWRPVDALAPEGDWASRVERADSEGASYTLERRARLQQPRSNAEDRTVLVADAHERVQIEGSVATLAGVSLERSDLQLEVSYIDPGLTALHTILWSLGSTALAWGSGFLAVTLSMVSGDCRCSPER